MAMAQPPGPRGRFPVGNTLQYMADPLNFLVETAGEFGDVSRLRLGNTTAYLLANPAHIEHVLRTRPEDFIKDKLTRFLSPIVGNGLLTNEGASWRRQRKLAQPGFLTQQVQSYGQVMVDHAGAMLEDWRDGQRRDIHEDMMRLTLGIVAKTLFGADVEQESCVVGASIDVMMDHFLDPLKWLKVREYLPLPSTLRFRAAVARVDRIIYGIIRRRRAEGHDPGDLLSRLLAARGEDGSGMSDRQLRDEVVTLFLAGHETTALTLSYAFHLLGGHPEVEARLHAELDEVLGDGPPTPADVPRLRYVEAVVKEAMRLYPPAWSIGREAIRDCEVGGYRVPKGTQLFLSQWVVHRDPRWFDEPLMFRPERWEGDLARRLPRCAYFPFGDGPRICIGVHFAMMEAILIIATVARRFRMTPADARPLELDASITLRPRNGIPMIVHDRRALGGPPPEAAGDGAERGPRALRAGTDSPKLDRRAGSDGVSPMATARLRCPWTGLATGLMAALALALSIGLGLIGREDAAPAGATPTPTPTLVVDPNEAPERVLVALPRLGPVLAGRIVEARERSPFRSVEDLDARVKGIGPVTIQGLRPHLHVAPAE